MTGLRKELLVPPAADRANPLGMLALNLTSKRERASRDSKLSTGLLLKSVDSFAYLLSLPLVAIVG